MGDAAVIRPGAAARRDVVGGCDSSRVPTTIGALKAAGFNLSAFTVWPLLTRRACCLPSNMSPCRLDVR